MVINSLSAWGTPQFSNGMNNQVRSSTGKTDYVASIKKSPETSEGKGDIKFDNASTSVVFK